MVVPQFWHAGITLVPPVVEDWAALSPPVSDAPEQELAWARANWAVLETRLLKAGQPLQPC